MKQSPSYQQLKKRVYEILEHEAHDFFGRSIAIFLVVLVCVNVIVAIIGTEESINAQYQGYFYTIELFSLAIFTFEYGFRLWTCNINERFQDPVKGRLKYAITFYAFIDLLAILPTYISIISVTVFAAAISFNLLFLRAFRLFRVFRVFKLGRYHDSFHTIKTVLSKKKGELFVAVFLGMIVLVVMSSVMFSAEHGAQPDKFSSIPTTMWWAAMTLTTIGYGDMYPVTGLGKLLAAAVAFLGIGLFALPAGILGSGFYEEFQHRRQKGEAITCPHCGKEITK